MLRKFYWLAILAILPVSPVQCQLKNMSITLRQCRWAPHTARDENGYGRYVTDLGAKSISHLFSFDSEEDWDGIEMQPSSLRANFYVPKWIFRNSGVQALLASLLLVDKVGLDSEVPSSSLYITAWNVLLCGVYKFHSQRNLYDLIVTEVLGEDNTLMDLIDLVYRLGLCVVNDHKDSCPSECHADESLVKSCSSIPNRKLGLESNCFTELEEGLKYEVFREAEFDKISFANFEREIDDFRVWHQTLSPAKRIPIEIFEENLLSSKLVLFALGEFLETDPDEKPVTLDEQFANLKQRFRDAGCNKDDDAVHKQASCLQFRALLHSRLVDLQKQLVSKRNCICALGYHWDRERDVCEKRVLDYCNEQNYCQNGGRCQAESVQIFESDVSNYISAPLEKIVINCLCPPAWKGQRCEVENDVCQTLPSTSTCGDHICERDPGSELGFSCICPPETHQRISDKDHRCRDINECTERNPELNPLCKNDGECENHDPGFICELGMIESKCRHGFGGSRCEFPPDPPAWGSWEEWGRCILPEKALACQESPMQVRIRRCLTKGVAQNCEGPGREIRFVCPGQMNQWDTLECSRFRGNITHRETGGYARLDYLRMEEFGKFSAHEFELVLFNSLTSYLWHCALLCLVFIYCVLTPVTVGWALWRILRNQVIISRLAETTVAGWLAKQSTAAAEMAKKQEAAQMYLAEKAMKQEEMTAAQEKSNQKQQMDDGSRLIEYKQKTSSKMTGENRSQSVDPTAISNDSKAASAVEPTMNSNDSKAASAVEPTMNSNDLKAASAVEPTMNSDEQETSQSVEPTEQETSPSAEPTEQETSQSIEPTEQETSPSAEPTEQETSQSDEQTDKPNDKSS